MQYVEILPLVNTGGGDSAFTYETDQDIQIGSLVSIPLRNRYVKGMVIKEVTKPKFKTREIKKVLSEEPVLSETQLKIAEKIADYYFCNLSDVIPAILSFDFGKKRRETEKTQIKNPTLQTKLKFTKDQLKIFEEIAKAKPGSKHLLFGVTGSGKTEIYLQLVAEALKKDKGSIILIPEISLTPQTAKRFVERFGETVVVWHSHLKETEKFATWQKIKSGQAKVVLGARSAIFSPIDDLGYIIIDEEHESSYKQDQTPRYETTRIAEWLADITGAKLVSGSATPKIESFYKTESGFYNLHKLEQRINQNEMPPVKIVDLRDEFKKGNKSIISDDLYEATVEALKNNKQVIMFVNRRGASTFVVCRDCGHVSECPKCEIPLTYHPSEGQVLKCHHCDHRETVPVICPECQSHAIKFFGLGTQRAEIEVKKMFPKARVARMDRDTTRKRGSHEQIYEDFSAGDSDILIGTQLIAKGWDLPNVAVVGVISADTMLNLPDFRSGERTFSLLTQVSGRTGRGEHAGKVVVQTYNPDNYAILAAAKHDYQLFYDREIKEREKYGYPPFSELIKLTYSSTDSKKAESEAERLAEILNCNIDKTCQVLGPSTAFIEKIAGKYRWQIVIKIPKESQTANHKLRIFEILRENIKPGWTVDISPESLL
jgi:primosomal protein N' (replication factor Y)